MERRCCFQSCTNDGLRHAALISQLHAHESLCCSLRMLSQRCKTRLLSNVLSFLIRFNVDFECFHLSRFFPQRNMISSLILKEGFKMYIYIYFNAVC